jgi:predicted SprT family Zn-dependent metalloprotease
MNKGKDMRYSGWYAYRCVSCQECGFSFKEDETDRRRYFVVKCSNCRREQLADRIDSLISDGEILTVDEKEVHI